MAIPKLINAQRDFSAGELDQSIKRADELPAMKAGARQMTNWRILSSKALQNRPGRAALFPLFGAIAGRIEEFTMQGTLFYLGFASGTLGVITAAGGVAVSVGSLPWTTFTVSKIVWTQIGNAIYIAYMDGAPNNQPLVLTWDGGSTWVLSGFTEAIDGAQKRTLFYRLAPQGITLVPSATTGNINIIFSANVLTAGMIGTRLEYAGRQLTITGVSSGSTGTATVNEALPPGQTLTLSSPQGAFNIGDEVKGSISGATGIVTLAANSQQLFGIPNNNFNVGDHVSGGTSGASATITQVAFFGFFAPYLLVQLLSPTVFLNGEVATDTNTGQTFTVALSGTSSSTTMTVQILPTASGNIVLFTTSDLVVGPAGSSTISAVATGAPQPIAIWDQEVMNNFRGWPASVFADQTRLGFTNFPAVPNGIAWSAIGQPRDFLVGALADDAIFELAPDNSQVFYVIPGMESSEFVFTDRAIYYIPISPTFPLEPGSVAFNKLSDYGSMPGVQPRRAEQSIIYIKAGGVQVGAVQAPGAYYRPYVVDHISELHSHLFTLAAPISIAVPSGPTQFEEQYLYIAMTDGSVNVGRYAMRQGLLEPGPEGKPAVGWLPWIGVGLVAYASARQGDVIFTTNYAPNGVPVVGIAEKVDMQAFLDGALLVNNLPAAFTPPGGKGPLFSFPGPNSTVFLIDLGTRFMGTYNVDVNGFIVPQFIGGENLASPQLVAGQPWNAGVVIFLPGAAPAQSARQRTLRRRVSQMAVHVSKSSGFYLGWVYNGPIGPLLPTPGTLTKFRRVPTYNIGDDATQPAPLREEVQRWRPLGRTWDPLIGVGKDTPGPLIIHEIAVEVTI